MNGCILIDEILSSITNIKLNIRLMLGRGNKLYSIFSFKCPKCHQGKLYKTPLSAFQGIYNMHDNCPKCKQKYELEPGFYWGAMYIGYGLSSAYMLLSCFILIVLLKFSLASAFIISILGAIPIVPLIARLARAIWININVSYNKKISDSVKEASKKES